MFKALYSIMTHSSNKYLQIYNHILLYLQWLKKGKIKTKKSYLQSYGNNDLQSSWLFGSAAEELNQGLPGSIKSN